MHGVYAQYASRWKTSMKRFVKKGIFFLSKWFANVRRQPSLTHVYVFFLLSKAKIIVHSICIRQPHQWIDTIVYTLTQNIRSILEIYISIVLT